MIGKSFKVVSPKRIELYLEDLNLVDEEVLVKVEYCAICKADIRYYLGSRDRNILGLKYPMSLIHEATGLVIKDKSGNFKVGDRVVLIPNIKEKEKLCFNCVCDIEELGENYCPKASFASSNYEGFGKEYVVHPSKYVLKIPEGIDDRIAVFAELVSVGFSILRRVDIKSYQNIGIWGDGILGYILSMVIDYTYKDKNIILIGKHEENIEKFKHVEACYLLGDPAIKNSKIEIAYECVGGKGSESAINDSINKLSVGGKLILSGVSEGNIPINTRKILEKGISIYGVTRSNKQDFKRALSALENKEFREGIESLILDVNNINNIIDYHRIFEKEINNKELGKNIMKIEI